MQIYGVSFDMVGKQPIVLLKTVDGNRFLPIWIGHPEAAAILMKLQGASTPRPMTHDLLSDMLDQLDAKCERVSVTELRDGKIFRWHDYSNIPNITDNAPAWWLEHIMSGQS